MDFKENINSEESAHRAIAWAIRELVGKNGLKDVQFMIGNVTAVNETDRTCDVEITLGDKAQKITGVNLNSNGNDGFIQIPAIDSDILLCLMQDNSAYMLSCEDITKCVCVIDENNKFEFDSTGMIFNDGALGGLMKIVEYTAKQNQLIAQLQAELALIATGIAAGGGTYTPGILSPFNKSDYENLKIKQ